VLGARRTQLGMELRHALRGPPRPSPPGPTARAGHQPPGLFRHAQSLGQGLRRWCWGRRRRRGDPDPLPRIGDPVLRAASAELTWLGGLRGEVLVAGRRIPSQIDLDSDCGHAYSPACSCPVTVRPPAEKAMPQFASFESVLIDHPGEPKPFVDAGFPSGSCTPHWRSEEPFS
jgi:hypothetical protein